MSQPSNLDKPNIADSPVPEMANPSLVFRNLEDRFDFHIDDMRDQNSKQEVNLIRSMNLKKYVKLPTTVEELEDMSKELRFLKLNCSTSLLRLGLNIHSYPLTNPQAKTSAKNIMPLLREYTQISSNYPKDAKHSAFTYVSNLLTAVDFALTVHPKFEIKNVIEQKLRENYTKYFPKYNNFGRYKSDTDPEIWNLTKDMLIDVDFHYWNLQVLSLPRVYPYDFGRPTVVKYWLRIAICDLLNCSSDLDTLVGREVEIDFNVDNYLYETHIDLTRLIYDYHNRLISQYQKEMDIQWSKKKTGELSANPQTYASGKVGFQTVTTYSGQGYSYARLQQFSIKKQKLRKTKLCCVVVVKLQGDSSITKTTTKKKIEPLPLDSESAATPRTETTEKVIMTAKPITEKDLQEVNVRKQFGVTRSMAGFDDESKIQETASRPGFDDETKLREAVSRPGFDNETRIKGVSRVFMRPMGFDDETHQQRTTHITSESQSMGWDDEIRAKDHSGKREEQS